MTTPLRQQQELRSAELTTEHHCFHSVQLDFPSVGDIDSIPMVGNRLRAQVGL